LKGSGLDQVLKRLGFFSRAVRAAKSAVALQFAEKLALRVTVSLERYRKSIEIRCPLGGGHWITTFSANCSAAEVKWPKGKKFFSNPPGRLWKGGDLPTGL
jgi:hypothetical protein